MDIKVVLTVFPFFNHVYTPPIQLAYLKSYLEQDTEISVKTIDAEMHFYSSQFFHDSLYYMEKIRSGKCKRDPEIDVVLLEVVDLILRENPDVVGLSVTNENVDFSVFVANQLKQRNPKLFIVFGGLRFSLRPGWSGQVALLHQELSEVDCIVKGEGEATFMELVQMLKKGEKITYCVGTTLRVDGKVIDCAERSLIPDIDNIPFPDFNDFDKNRYLSDYIRILFGRGCVGRCNYCTENYTMGTFRSRTPENILSEIKLRITQGYRRFQTCDLALNSDMRCLVEVCQMLVKEKIDVEFIFSQFRHSSNLNREVFALFRKAGFKVISFGTESASQIILDRMLKGVKVKTIEQNIRDAYTEGLKVIMFFMVGFPGETEKTFSETVEFIRKNAKYISAIQHVADVNINWSSGIHENCDRFDLEITSLFIRPDKWQTKDGKNNLIWRRELVRRMIKYISDFGISFVDFSENGNPCIVSDNPVLLISPEEIKNYRKNIPKKNNKFINLAEEYKSNIKILRKENVNDRFMFLLLITNLGERTWERFGSDWIQVGCKIYKRENLNTPIAESRQALPYDIKKGESFSMWYFIIANLLLQRELLIKFDLLNEFQFWFEDLGSKVVVSNIDSLS